MCNIFTQSLVSIAFHRSASGFILLVIYATASTDFM